LRVALDATALFGPRTGVGVFTAEVLARAGDDFVEMAAFAVTWRGRGDLASALPPGVRRVGRMPMAARPLRALWSRVDAPPIDWWIGPAAVVHGPNFVVPPARHAARLVTVHDLTPWRFPELANNDTRQYPRLVRRAIDHGAHVHVHTRAVADEVVDTLGADVAKVHVVPAGVSDTAGGDGSAGRARAGTDAYVLALGTVEPRKDLPLLVRAFDALAAHHRELRLVVAGPDGWGVGAYNAAVAAAVHRDRIVRLGWVDDAARADLLAGAAVFAYPSRYEGFGLPPLEAMLAGVPVVATAVDSLVEVCGDGAALVPSSDLDALAAAIEHLLGDAGAREALVARGHARAATFSWDRCAEGLRAVYQLVGRGHE
jgi:glycosyltransferase involved in cell wall biosynthesis